MSVRELRLLAGLLLVALFGMATIVQAQDEEPGLTLRLNRDFGYRSGGRIEGRFSYRVEGPEELERVAFYLDETLIGEDGEAPFRLQFHTNQYELGVHRMSAIGYTADGRELTSNVIVREFVTPQTGWLNTAGIVALVAVFIVASHLITRRLQGGQGGKRSYGFHGGAVCVQCGRPIPIPWWSPGLLVGRLVRCPHCGKWQLRPRATPQQLAAAEAFEQELAEMDRDAAPADDAERRRRLIEESRYTDQ